MLVDWLNGKKSRRAIFERVLTECWATCPAKLKAKSKATAKPGVPPVYDFFLRTFHGIAALEHYSEKHSIILDLTFAYFIE
jgi:hypothetical protein